MFTQTQNTMLTKTVKCGKYCPFPSIAKSEPEFSQKYSGNSWGFFSQALTIL